MSSRKSLTCSFVYNYFEHLFSDICDGLWAEGVTGLCSNRHLLGKSIHGFKKLSEVRRVIEASRIKKNYKRSSFL